MKQLGLNAECLGNEALTYSDSAQAGGNSLNGAYAFAPYMPSVMPQFVKAWRAKFHAIPNDESYGLGYVGFAVALQAMKAIKGNITPSKLNTMLHTKTFKVNLGVGKVKYLANGDNACATMYVGEIETNTTGNNFNLIKNLSLKC